MFLFILVLFLTCLGIFTYHYKKKTKYYVNFVDSYYKPITKAYSRKKVRLSIKVHCNN